MEPEPRRSRLDALVELDPQGEAGLLLSHLLGLLCDVGPWTARSATGAGSRSRSARLRFDARGPDGVLSVLLRVDEGWTVNVVARGLGAAIPDPVEAARVLVAALLGAERLLNDADEPMEDVDLVAAGSITHGEALAPWLGAMLPARSTRTATAPGPWSPAAVGDAAPRAGIRTAATVRAAPCALSIEADEDALVLAPVRVAARSLREANDAVTRAGGLAGFPALVTSSMPTTPPDGRASVDDAHPDVVSLALRSIIRALGAMGVAATTGSTCVEDVWSLDGPTGPLSSESIGIASEGMELRIEATPHDATHVHAMSIQGMPIPDDGPEARLANASLALLEILGTLATIPLRDGPSATSTIGDYERSVVGHVQGSIARSGFEPWARRATWTAPTRQCPPILEATDLESRVDTFVDTDRAAIDSCSVDVSIDRYEIVRQPTTVQIALPIDPVAVLRGEPLAPERDEDDD